MTIELCKIVFRNRGNGRKDAAYVIQVTHKNGGPYRVGSFYGSWTQYRNGTLRPTKAISINIEVHAQRKTKELVNKRMERGYEISRAHSSTMAGWQNVTPIRHAPLDLKRNLHMPLTTQRQLYGSASLPKPKRPDPRIQTRAGLLELD